MSSIKILVFLVSIPAFGLELTLERLSPGLIQATIKSPQALCLIPERKPQLMLYDFLQKFNKAKKDGPLQWSSQLSLKNKVKLKAGYPLQYKIRYANQDGGEVLLDHIHPQLFKPDCISPVAAAFDIKLKNFQAIGPKKINSRNVALLLKDNLKVKQDQFGATRLYFWGSPENGDYILRQVKQILAHHERWLGPFPYPELTIVHSDANYRSDLPGLLIINKPRQALFKQLQKNYLNWGHWVLTGKVAAQWWGSSIYHTKEIDKWLYTGTIDFLTFNYLQEFGQKYNIFNSYELDFHLLSFNYQQFLDVSASLLRQKSPFATLTDANWQSKGEQNHLIYIKHALALRQLTFSMGRGKSQRFFQKISKKYHNRNLSPKEFAMEFKGKLRENLKNWWQKSIWPDLELSDFKKTKLNENLWLAQAEIKTKHQLRYPTQIKLSSSQQQNYVSQISPPANDEAWHVSLLSKDEPLEMSIDPHHHIYDSDRFNNHSHSQGLSFFPLGTNTLSDERYTSLWAPYAFRHPGGEISIALQAVLMRYLNSGLYGRFEFYPQSKSIGYYLNHRIIQSDAATKWQISFEQDQYRYRTGEILITRKPLFKRRLGFVASGGLRYKTSPKDPEHTTFFSQLTYGRRAFKCPMQYQVELESALKHFSPAVNYQRYFHTLEFNCPIVKKFRYKFRIFQGGSHRPLESTYYLITNPTEAGMRINSKQVYRNLVSTKQDFMFPLSNPFGGKSSLLLKHLRGRFFVDTAKNRHLSSGFGLELPFGGDLVGSGPLALTNLSILGIFYSRNLGVSSWRPHWVFNISSSF